MLEYIYEDDKSIYLVLKEIEGEMLSQITLANRLSIKEKVFLFRSIAVIVRMLQEMGIVHRDLKPENIIVKLENR